VLVSRVAAAECKIYGDVYRISVSCTPQQPAGHAADHTSAWATANGRVDWQATAGTIPDGTANAALETNFLTISWVYDLK
jgi:hypothetical protein